MEGIQRFIRFLSLFHIFFYLKCFKEAEEKMLKMKEEYTKCKEREITLVEEIERLKKKLINQEIKSNPSFSKQNKGEISSFFVENFRLTIFK